MLIEVIASCLLAGTTSTWAVPPKWEVQRVESASHKNAGCWLIGSQTVCGGGVAGETFRVIMKRVFTEGEELPGSALCLYTMRTVRE